MCGLSADASACIRYFESADWQRIFCSRIAADPIPTDLYFLLLTTTADPIRHRILLWTWKQIFGQKSTVWRGLKILRFAHLYVADLSKPCCEHIWEVQSAVAEFSCHACVCVWPNFFHHGGRWKWCKKFLLFCIKFITFDAHNYNIDVIITSQSTQCDATWIGREDACNWKCSSSKGATAFWRERSLFL